MNILVISSVQKYVLKGHERHSRDSCHESWDPEYYCIHIGYDPQETQWDHLKQKATLGSRIKKIWVG